MSTVGDELPKQIARVRDDLLPVYDGIPGGQIAASLMRADLDRASKAMIAGDVVEMVRAHEALKGWQL